MIVAGCDIGSLTAKAVIMKNNEILGSALMRAKNNPSVSAAEVMDMAVKEAGISMQDLNCIVGTGYGKEQIPFVNETKSEISCHGKGAFHMMPSVRMVIDIGGQDSKATAMNAKGEVIRYMYNDKCASGTGRFLEVMAEALEVPLEKMGAAGAKSTEMLSITNQCVIFAETEVVSLVNEGKEASDIINGLHHSLGKRVASMAKSIGVKADVVMTGGVAKNSGVFKAISEVLEISLKSLDGVDPQLVGALGAALYAQEKAGA
jgi:predicted CoA-substrate-specific enzyme activase